MQIYASPTEKKVITFLLYFAFIYFVLTMTTIVATLFYPVLLRFNSNMIIVINSGLASLLAGLKLRYFSWTLIMQEIETKFLTDLLAQNKIINIYLKNGIRLPSKLLAHDNRNLYLQDRTGVPSSVLKSAVSTVSPNY